MNEHPKHIKLLESNHQEIPDDKIDALSVTHAGKMVGNSFEYSFKNFLFMIRKVTGTIDVLFDL
jgi:hypothetical protein